MLQILEAAVLAVLVILAERSPRTRAAALEKARKFLSFLQHQVMPLLSVQEVRVVELEPVGPGVREGQAWSS